MIKIPDGKKKKPNKKVNNTENDLQNTNVDNNIRKKAMMIEKKK